MPLVVRGSFINSQAATSVHMWPGNEAIRLLTHVSDQQKGQWYEH